MATSAHLPSVVTSHVFWPSFMVNCTTGCGCKSSSSAYILGEEGMQTYQTGASNLLPMTGFAPRQRPGPSAGAQSHGCTGSCRTMVPLPARHCETYDSGSGTPSGSSKRAAPGMTGRWWPRPRQLCISCTTCQHALNCLQHMQAACMQSTAVCMQMPLLRTCLHLFGMLSRI